MTRRTSRGRPAWAGASVLVAALSVELVDELVDGTKGAALPLIRQSLSLTYLQVGLLASVPLLLGSLLELPMGIAAGHGRRRRQAVLAGGVMFFLTLVAAAEAGTFIVLLIALVAFYPASGAFVSLSQSGLMDAAPGRPEQNMARWTLAGSVGSVAGPLLLVAVLAGGGSWRAAYLVLAACAAAAWLVTVRSGPPQLASPDVSRAEQRLSPDQPGRPDQGSRAVTVRRAVSVLRRGEVMRWVVLLEVADLLGDVLTGFVALYFVDVLHATPAQAALGVAIRLGASLAGDAALLAVLERAAGISVLRASAAAAAVLYPAFLLVPGIGFKFIILAALSVATAPWYTVLQAQLYRSLPGESGIAVSLMSAAGLVSGIGPLAVGFLAERYGLAWALAALALAPACLLGGLRRGRARP